MLPSGQVRIYLACGFTDMRKGFHSLATQVQTSLQQENGCARRERMFAKAHLATESNFRFRCFCMGP